MDYPYNKNHLYDIFGGNMQNVSCEFLAGNFRHNSHRDGTFYMGYQSFPWVLHDLDGCLHIRSELEYAQLVSAGVIRPTRTVQGEKINVPHGIAAIGGYIKCPNVDKCPKCKIRKRQGVL